MITLREVSMLNEDGMYYGVHVHVRGIRNDFPRGTASAEDIVEALSVLADEYGDERVFGSTRITDQFRWSFYDARKDWLRTQCTLKRVR